MYVWTLKKLTPYSAFKRNDRVPLTVTVTLSLSPDPKELLATHL